MSESRGTFPLRAAAIDIGSNAIRFLAAEFPAPERFRVLDAERGSVRLGHGVFLTGKLTREAMDAAVGLVSGFKSRMDALGVTRHRAAATSAVREAANGARFVDRVRRETGVEIEPISGSEEARLVYLAVKQRLPLGNGNWILADLGGGSVEVSLVSASGVAWSQSHTMGSVRLLEELAGAGQEPGRFRRLLEEYISTLRVPEAGRKTPRGFIATGGNMETLARLATGAENADEVRVVPVVALRAVIERLSRMSYRQRVDELGLREDRADVILPAALVYERLAVLAGAGEIVVPGVGVREGIVLDLADEAAAATSHQDRRTSQLMAAAVALGRHYMFDEPHGVHVADLAVSLFDQLRELHGLGIGDRRVLAAAATLHDIGAFISYKRHHKHTLYLVANSELPGLSAEEMQVVANVARYHRKSEPDTDHEEFVRLTETDQRRVRRLASLLRMADALDREHLAKVSRVRATVRGGELQLQIEGDGDLLLERWSLERKSEFFTHVFDLKVRATAAGTP